MSLNWYSESELAEAQELKSRELREIHEGMTDREILEQWALRQTRDPGIFKALVRNGAIKRQ